VPAECATTWDEAGKDVCFERAARRSIAASPGAWLAHAPGKVAATLDYFGAGPWYLHAVDADAFGEGAKRALGAVETVACRLLLLGALWAVARREGPRARARSIVAVAGALGAVTAHGWIGYVAVVVAVALLGRRALAGAPVLVPAAAAVTAATVAVHAVFFGAGRYGLVVVPFVAALAFTASTARSRSLPSPERPSRAP
jgi:hypothetical protein